MLSNYKTNISELYNNESGSEIQIDEDKLFGNDTSDFIRDPDNTTSIRELWERPSNPVHMRDYITMNDKLDALSEIQKERSRKVVFDEEKPDPSLDKLLDIVSDLKKEINDIKTSNTSEIDKSSLNMLHTDNGNLFKQDSKKSNINCWYVVIFLIVIIILLLLKIIWA